MEIKQLYVSNFRGIKNLNIDFADKEGKIRSPLAMHGFNGSGKTSVLEAIVLLLGRKELLKTWNKEADVSIGAEDYEISGIINIKGTDVHLMRTSKTKRVMGWVNDYPVEYFPSWRNPRLVGPVSVTVSKRGKVDDNIENRLYWLKQYFVDLTASIGFMRSEEERRIAEEILQDKLTKLNRIWKLIYPDTQEKLAVGVAGEEVCEGFDLFLDGRKGGRIPIDWLGAGELEFLTMIGRFIKDDFKGGIVLIDEPELHLHNTWHERIVLALKEFLPDTQIIVTTNSTSVLKSIGAMSVVSLI